VTGSETGRTKLKTRTRLLLIWHERPGHSWVMGMDPRNLWCSCGTYLGRYE